jgi:hypothetical protein
MSTPSGLASRTTKTCGSFRRAPPRCSPLSTEAIDVVRGEKDAIQPPELSLSPEAFTLWRQFQDDVERELGRTGEFSELSDFGAKAAEQAARIACVLHIFEHGPAGTITPEMMIAGARMAAWHLTEARRGFAVIGQVGEASDAQLLLEWLQDQADDKMAFSTFTPSATPPGGAGTGCHHLAPRD